MLQDQIEMLYYKEFLRVGLVPRLAPGWSGLGGGVREKLDLEMLKSNEDDCAGTWLTIGHIDLTMPIYRYMNVERYFDFGEKN